MCVEGDKKNGICYETPNPPYLLVCCDLVDFKRRLGTSPTTFRLPAVVKGDIEIFFFVWNKTPSEDTAR